MSTSILNKANNFIKYFKSLNKIEIDEKLIYEYYILTADKYTSHYDAYMWLGQTKKSLSQNLQSNYVLDTNYWIVPYETEKLYVKLYLDTFDYEKERKYYLLHPNTFRDICLKSLKENGKKIRKYYTIIDDIFRDFAVKYDSERDNTIEILLHNQKKIKFDHTEGIYVWRETGDEKGIYRIGCTEDLYNRINTHNSSHSNKIVVNIIKYVSCAREIESVIHTYLKDYKYRNEFYKGDIKIINNAITNIVHSMTKYRSECKCNTTCRNDIQKIKKQSKNMAKFKKLSKKKSKKGSNKKFKNSHI